jgi:sarcosine oxidase
MAANGGSRIPASLWADTAPTGPVFALLRGEVKVDVAVIGAGYTGLSAALHLAERGIDVAVIESEEPGFGASGRNGGQLNPGLKHGRAALRARFGERRGDAMFDAAADAVRFTLDLVRRCRIDCDAVRRGTLRLAHSETAVAGLRSAAEELRGEGVPVRELVAAEVEAEVGTKAYAAGLLDPRGGHLHPLRYVHGLARAAAGAGARIFSHSPARRLQRQGVWRVDTDAGAVLAEWVVVATNGYTDGLVRGLRRTLLPVHSFQIATEPLSAARLARIMPQRPSVYDSRRLVLYFRLTGEDRLILGGRASFSTAERASDYDVLRRVLTRLFPDLADVAITHSWVGRVALTADSLPHLHMPEPGLVAALGYNGRGVAMATRMGAIVADLIEKGAEHACFAVTPLRPIPLHGFRQPVLHLAMLYHAARDAIGR